MFKTFSGMGTKYFNNLLEYKWDRVTELDAFFKYEVKAVTACIMHK